MELPVNTESFLYSCRELRRAGVLGLLLCATAFALACGGTPPDGGASETSGLKAPSDPDQLVLDGATVLEMDYRAILEASELPLSGLIAVLSQYEGAEDTPDLQEQIRDEWDDLDASLGTDAADVETLMSIAIQSAGYFVVKGTFDFGDIERELEARDFEEDTYRDRQVWEHERGESVALFHESGMYIYGGDDVVKDVLRALARGEGFMDDEAGLRRALGAAGDGLVRLAMDCDELDMHSPGSLSTLAGRLDDRCEGVAVVVSSRDEDRTDVVIGYVYGSERLAESAVGDIEESIERSGEIEADIAEIGADGDTVTIRLTVYEGSSGRVLAAPAPAPTPVPAPAPTAQTAPTPAPAPTAQPAPTPAPAPTTTPTPTPSTETALQNPLSATRRGRIAFESDSDGRSSIYVMNADGSGVTRLTDNERYNYGPSWSPDGRRIAFESDDDIYVMNGDGSDLTRLNDSEADDEDPSWSPDGRRIAFVSWGDETTPSIYVMGADGSGVTRLTDNERYNYDPSWSPDGQRIAFESSGEIYVMNADGSNPTPLTDSGASGAGYLVPSWSPDGRRIAFVSDRDGNVEIYVMNVDGSNVTRLTDNPGWDWAPSWSPDGRRIAFESNRDENGKDIYVMNADGSDVTRLTDNSADDENPRWSPAGGSSAAQPAHVASPTLPAGGEVAELSINSSPLQHVDATVKAGTLVIWTNNTILHHTVTHIATDGNRLFDSDSIASDASFRFYFTEPGTYGYQCSIHPVLMKGTITVTE